MHQGIPNPEPLNTACGCMHRSLSFSFDLWPGFAPGRVDLIVPGFQAPALGFGFRFGFAIESKLHHFAGDASVAMHDEREALAGCVKN